LLQAAKALDLVTSRSKSWCRPLACSNGPVLRATFYCRRTLPVSRSSSGAGVTCSECWSNVRGLWRTRFC